ncbi:MAG TPA: hypothetical protein VLY86_03995 [Methanothrix sp.]|nr:hypothetical protein [Methanothrix sp.]
MGEWDQVSTETYTYKFIIINNGGYQIMDLITISIIVFWGLALWIISGLKGLARRRNAILLFPEEK